MKRIAIILLIVAAITATNTRPSLVEFFSAWTEFNRRMRQELLYDKPTPYTNNKTILTTSNQDPYGSSDNLATPQLQNKKTFADIKGPIPQEIYDLVDFFRDNSNFTDVGALMPKGILLVGPPGTGKTSIARALANEAGVPFFDRSASDFIEIYVGTGAKRIRDLFTEVRSHLDATGGKHAIIFIDEIDAIGNRNGHLDDTETRRTINELLTQMDGFKDDNRITVIAATNRQDLVDPALKRPGRFDYIIEVPLPDYTARLEILNYYLYGQRHNRKTVGTIDLVPLAKKAHNFSGADLSSVINRAAVNAVHAKRGAIKQEDLDEALAKTMQSKDFA